MGARSTSADLQTQLNILSWIGVAGDLTDGQLLQTFLSGGDGDSQAAFTVLVERHGPMVMAVCRSVAWQLVRYRRRVPGHVLGVGAQESQIRSRNGESVASWLHGVALWVSKRARSDAFRRIAYERRWAEMRPLRYDRTADPTASWTELHEEIDRLPVRFRDPLVRFTSWRAGPFCSTQWPGVLRRAWDSLIPTVEGPGAVTRPTSTPPGWLPPTASSPKPLLQRRSRRLYPNLW